MPLSFKIRKTFTSPLSAAEAAASLQELLNSRSKLLFFTFATNSGSMSGNEFILRTHKGDRFGLFSPKIKGSIHSQDPTIVNTQIVIPYLIICFYLVFPITSLPIVLFTDEMTINGVQRAPELSERIGFSLLVTLVPAFLIYLSTIWPVKGVENRLIAALKLEGNH